jgi:hypothetical protein
MDYIPIFIGDTPVVADIGFATPKDLDELARWQASETNTSPRVWDAAEFASLALRKFRDYHQQKMSAGSLGDCKDRLLLNPKCEFAFLILAKPGNGSPNLPPILGATLCRRTWNGSIVVDYLTTNPALDEWSKRNQKVGGVASGLLAYLADIGAEISARRLVAETTPLSIGFYHDILSTSCDDDVIILDWIEMAKFSEERKSKNMQKITAAIYGP